MGYIAAKPWPAEWHAIGSVTKRWPYGFAAVTLRSPYKAVTLYRLLAIFIIFSIIKIMQKKLNDLRN
jgi:hypothetical protein